MSGALSSGFLKADREVFLGVIFWLPLKKDSELGASWYLPNLIIFIYRLFINILPLVVI